ncbi:MAG: ribose-phosphate pyrophosphokinase [Lachnospiraceae bacterium]|nr:ribose-phosphate pyrophosphokinase [Lachnospiraceae bacterium]
MSEEEKKLVENVSYGPMGIIALESSRSIGAKVNDWIASWRDNRDSKYANTPDYDRYQRDSYLIDAKCPRFGSGEAKCIINETIRGLDVYILVDVCNYSLTYKVCGQINHMSPDDHFADLKRVISAISGKAARITVIMPFLYESRQHKRSARESLDCALALQELVNLGVDSIITFDAHDPRVQNAIPTRSFEDVKPTYQFTKALLRNVPDLVMDSSHLMIVSPDEGAMGRAVYFATMIGADMGMFYKRRDYSRIVDGRNPIVAHEFLGNDVQGKDVIVIDDMISSGESMLDVARELKQRNAGRIFVCSTFGLFTNGLEKFDKAYKEGLIDRVVTTNLIYQTPELLERDWYISADMSKYIALLIDSLNHDASISKLLNPTDRIHRVLERHRNGEKI